MLALNSLSCLLYQCFNRSLAYVFDLPLMCACMCVRACVRVFCAWARHGKHPRHFDGQLVLVVPAP